MGERKLLFAVFGDKSCPCEEALVEGSPAPAIGEASSDLSLFFSFCFSFSVCCCCKTPAAFTKLCNVFATKIKPRKVAADGGSVHKKKKVE